MIVAWIVKCDNCGKLIDATQETFHEGCDQIGDLCGECWMEQNGEGTCYDEEDYGASIVNGELC